MKRDILRDCLKQLESTLELTLESTRESLVSSRVYRESTLPCLHRELYRESLVDSREGGDSPKQEAYVDPKVVQQMLQGVAKNMNPAYRKAKEARRKDEYQWRLNRIYKWMRKSYSSHRMIDIQKKIMRSSKSEVLDWLRGMEEAYAQTKVR